MVFFFNLIRTAYWQIDILQAKSLVLLSNWYCCEFWKPQLVLIFQLVKYLRNWMIIYYTLKYYFKYLLWYCASNLKCKSCSVFISIICKIHKLHVFSYQLYLVTTVISYNTETFEHANLLKENLLIIYFLIFKNNFCIV